MLQYCNMSSECEDMPLYVCGGKTKRKLGDSLGMDIFLCGGKGIVLGLYVCVGVCKVKQAGNGHKYTC